MTDAKESGQPANHRRRLWIAAAGLLWGFLLTGGRAGAETQTTVSIRDSADGATAAALAPGAPAGSYTSTDFESTNVYNGRLNVALPLLTVGGRGEAGYTMVLKATRPPWTVETRVIAHYFSAEPNPPDYYSFWNDVSATWWNPFETGYGPGVLVEKRWRGGLGQCLGSDPFTYSKSFTYFVFEAPDGTEHALYDTTGKNIIETSPGAAPSKQRTVRD
jgi:hypothetical protein